MDSSTTQDTGITELVCDVNMPGALLRPSLLDSFKDFNAEYYTPDGDLTLEYWFDIRSVNDYNPDSLLSGPLRD